MLINKTILSRVWGSVINNKGGSGLVTGFIDAFFTIIVIFCGVFYNAIISQTTMAVNND